MWSDGMWEASSGAGPVSNDGCQKVINGDKAVSIKVCGAVAGVTAHSKSVDDAQEIIDSDLSVVVEVSEAGRAVAQVILKCHAVEIYFDIKLSRLVDR